LDDFSLRVLEAVRVVGQPLLGRGDGGWTGMYVVLERAPRAGTSYKGTIVDCSRTIKTAAQGHVFMSDWSRQGGSGRSLHAPPRSGAHAGAGDPPPPPATVRDDGGGDEGDSYDDIDADACLRDTAGSDKDDTLSDPSGGADEYPSLVFNARQVIQKVAAAQMGQRTLELVDMEALLSSCGLRDIKQISYDMATAIFVKGSKAVKDQKKVLRFEWTQVCPPQLLHNRWMLHGNRLSVDGNNFYPPNHGRAKNHGDIEHKRLALCIAAHLSPFWRAIFVAYFTDNPVSKKPLAKRFRGADDAFSKAKSSVPAKKARLSLKGKPRCGVPRVNPPKPLQPSPPPPPPPPPPPLPPPPPAGGAMNHMGGRGAPRGAGAAGAAANAGGGQGWRGGGLPPPANGGYPRFAPRAPLPLPESLLRTHVLASVTSRLPVCQVAAMRPAPILPETTRFSTFPLGGAAMFALTRREQQLKVLLPKGLLSAAMKAMEGGSGGSIALDGGSVGVGGDGEVALQIEVDGHEPLRCTTATLASMAAVHRYNESWEICVAFYSWMRPFLSAGAASFPPELVHLVGARLPVAEVARLVMVSVGKLVMTDTVWRYFSVDDGMLGAMVGCNLYGGYSIPIVEVLIAGQRRFLTNGMLDAALVELREHCMGVTSPSAVLLTNQSAAFTGSVGHVVEEADARDKAKEVLGVLPSRPYVRYVMLLNLINKHWISAEVLIHSGTIKVFDSSAGSYAPQKASVVRRVVLFAEEALRFQRATDPTAPTWTEWNVVDVTAPRQTDDYNCGAFALAHLWCAIDGRDLASIHCVGDLIRLAMIYTLVERGRVYDDARAEAQAPV